MGVAVSVILPNYNHAPYLVERLESILNQDFTDFEVILLDDHSTDNSREILGKYAENDRVTHYLENDSNSGSTFLQWKKGLEKATGEFIWIAESDDVASPGFLSALVAKLRDNSEMAVAFSASDWIDEAGRVIHRTGHESEALWAAAGLITGDFLKGPVIYNASSAVFRKEAVRNVDFEELSEFRYAGDWLFWVQLIRGKMVYRTADRLNYFRRHEGNVSFPAEREGLQFVEGLKVVYYIFRHYRLPFLKKRRTLLYWAWRIARSRATDAGKIVAGYPAELRIYTSFFKLISG